MAFADISEKIRRWRGLKNLRAELQTLALVGTFEYLCPKQQSRCGLYGYLAASRVFNNAVISAPFNGFENRYP
jgi:hypothetical protein